MLSIQDAGLSVFSDTPKNFYIFGGSEYGIKAKYIDILVSKIGNKIEYDSVKSIIDLMSKYHIVPLQPQVYVIRYDKDFVSNINKDLQSTILGLNIVGTVVLIYEDVKDVTKLDKFFPDNTVSIDPIDLKHMCKYLSFDFPDLDKNTIEFAAKHAINYFQAKSICGCLNIVKDKVLLTERQMISLFDIQETYANDDIQMAVASKNFNALIYISEHYDGDLQNILYQILRTMIELDKIQSSKYSNSPLKKCAKNWSRADIYFMFNHTYNMIKSLRSGNVADIPDVITYLAALLVFQNIPDTRLLA